MFTVRAGRANYYGSGVTPAPTVTGVSKSVVDAGGGSSIVITGSGFSGASAVTFGGTAAASYTVDSAMQITAVTPAKTASATPVAVAVTTAHGTGTLASAVEFFAPSNIPGRYYDLEPQNHTNVAGVGTWTDASGNGYTFTGAAGGVNATIGSIPVVRFDGSTGLEEDATLAPLPASISHFRVAKNSDAVSDHLSGRWGTTGNFSYVVFHSGDLLDEYARSDRASISPAPGLNFLTMTSALYCLEHEVDGSAQTWNANLNGYVVAQQTGVTMQFPASTRMGPLVGGAGHDIALELSYAPKLADADAKRVRLWIEDKFGVSAKVRTPCNIRGYGHSVAAGFNASSIGTTDMYPRTIQALQAAAPGIYSLSYLGHPGEQISQWTADISTDITPYWVDGAVNILCVIELFNSLNNYAAANPSWTSSQIATQVVSDTIAYCAAVKAVKPWLIVLYMTYTPYVDFLDPIRSAALTQIIATLNAAVGQGNVDAVIRLDQDATLDVGFQSAPPTAITDDGTHPIDAGHQRIANATVPVIATLYSANA